uniref:Uncharacterized protein n=1 Tax=Physcomitrium patens TaxID=3218 RepID=A0A2K1IUE5_PHYPA|nr:hypothetical protein PHYPA_024840 [Physcomitrium patens]
MTYKESKKLQKPKVADWHGQLLDIFAKDAKDRNGFATPAMKASFLDVADRGCGHLTPRKHLKGYGGIINHIMSISLRDDVIPTAKRAMAAGRKCMDHNYPKLSS